MKIDQLPIEMLMKIFGFLPRHDEVSLVSKLFYSVSCKVNDSNICLTVDECFFDLELLQSARNSSRQISKVDIDFPCGRKQVNLPTTIISIIETFSASIKQLRINALMSMAEFLEILSFVPNVEHLVCDCLRLREENDTSNEIASTNDYLNLHKLRILKFWNCCNQFTSAFNRLPTGVLKELDIHNFNLDGLTILLQRQTNIKRLGLTGAANNTLAADIFDHLQLESIEMSHGPCYNYATVLSKQTKLKSLTLPHAEVDADFMNFVANQFTELETLSMDVPQTLSGDAIAKISKLENLKDLSLSFVFAGHMGRLETLTRSHCHAITALAINDARCTSSVIKALAKFVPNLKALKSVGHIDNEEFDALRTNFNFVEVLTIIRYSPETQLTDDDCFNPKLTELVLNYPAFDTPFLNKLIADYPNLRKLEIRCNSVTALQFRQILIGFKKLESLKLDRCYHSQAMEFFNYLKDHKNNLKFVSFADLNVPVTNDLKRELSATFGVVVYGRHGILRMAVDRRTINSEQEWFWFW